MSIAGTYDIVTKTPMGEQPGRLTVIVSGNTFTGVSQGPMGTMDVRNGTVDGNRLTWTMDMKVPMAMTLDCEATVDGDAIAGKVTAGAFGSMPLNGIRAA